MAIKDILQTLIDDAMVDQDKVGSANYFWAFPSKAAAARKRKISEREQQLQELTEKKAMLTSSIANASKGKEDSSDRKELLEQLAKEQTENESLTKELAMYSACDPEALQAKRKQVTVLRDGANRWTDNLETIKSYCSRKFNMQPDAINKQFGIPADLEYLE